MRWLLFPEVAGGLGDDTIVDDTVYPPHVTRLHYELEDWFGDDLVMAFPCYLVTAALAKSLRNSDLVGWQLAHAKVTASSDYFGLHSDDDDLPRLRWLQIIGDREADFSLSTKHQLEVSQRAIDLLRRHRIVYTQVFEVPGSS